MHLFLLVCTTDVLYSPEEEEGEVEGWGIQYKKNICDCLTKSTLPRLPLKMVLGRSRRAGAVNSLGYFGTLGFSYLLGVDG